MVVNGLDGLLKRRLIYIFMICLPYLNMNWTANFFTLFSHLDDLGAIHYVQEV